MLHLCDCETLIPA